MEYKADPSFNLKFQIQMSRDESIMRFMYTALDKHAVAYNARKRSGTPAVAPTPATEKTNSVTENQEG
jgi:small subunit ribosomal protein S6